MAERETVYWTGKSGTRYKYWIYRIPYSFDPDQDGNYIYCKIGARQQWVPIYIGEGDLKERADLEKHHQRTCIKRERATHFHAHTKTHGKAREDEEADLLNSHPEAYAPKGCNVKKGG